MMRAPILFAALTLLAPSLALANDYPNKPVRMVVPYPPGGSTDLIARVVAKGLGDALKQPFVVENRGGASGMIGADLVAKAPADGYSLLVTASGPHAVNVSLFPKITYDPVKDFEPVSLLITIPLLMVAPADAPYGTVQQFIDWAKANPQKANYCSIGPGSPSHLAAELFRSMAKLQLTHVPYKGSAPALVDTVAGVCPVLFDSAVSSGQQVKAGKLKALAIGTEARHPAWQATPTVAEAGVPGFSAYTWIAVVAPAGTPAPIVTRLNAEIVRLMANEDVRRMLAEQGADPAAGTPKQFADFADQEIAKWAKVIKEGGIRPD